MVQGNMLSACKSADDHIRKSWQDNEKDTKNMVRAVSLTDRLGQVNYAAHGATLRDMMAPPAPECRAKRIPSAPPPLLARILSRGTFGVGPAAVRTEPHLLPDLGPFPAPGEGPPALRTGFLRQIALAAHPRHLGVSRRRAQSCARHPSRPTALRRSHSAAPRSRGAGRPETRPHRHRRWHRSRPRAR